MLRFPYGPIMAHNGPIMGHNRAINGPWPSHRWAIMAHDLLCWGVEVESHFREKFRLLKFTSQTTDFRE